MKKDEYKRPESIVVDGEIVNFHYNKDERLKMTGLTFDRENNSFFSKKNRHIHILIVDVLLIAIIGMILTSFYGRSKKVIYNDITFTVSRKAYSKNKIMTFNIQIKNESSQVRELPGNIIYFYLLTSDNQKIHMKEIFIEKIRYFPSEFYIENIVINDLKPDIYNAVLELDNDNKITVDFRTK